MIRCVVQRFGGLLFCVVSFNHADCLLPCHYDALCVCYCVCVVSPGGKPARTHTLEGHTRPITWLIVHGGRAYSSSYDFSLRVWDLCAGGPATHTHTFAGAIMRMLTLRGKRSDGEQTRCVYVCVSVCVYLYVCVSGASRMKRTREVQQVFLCLYALAPAVWHLSRVHSWGH